MVPSHISLLKCISTLTVVLKNQLIMLFINLYQNIIYKLTIYEETPYFITL